MDKADEQYEENAKKCRWCKSGIIVLVLALTFSVTFVFIGHGTKLGYNLFLMDAQTTHDDVTQVQIDGRQPSCQDMADTKKCLPEFVTGGILENIKYTTDVIEKLHVTLDQLNQVLNISEGMQHSLEAPIYRFLPHYKNPCWIEAMSEPSTLYKDNQYLKQKPIYRWLMNKTTEQLDQQFKKGVRHRLRCLPLVYIAGFMKSGTSDLRTSLQLHPDAYYVNAMHYIKSASGSPQRRMTMLRHYIDLYDGAALQLRENFGQVCTTKREFHPGVIFEQEEGLLFSYNQAFESLPWNEGEDSVPSFHMVHVLRLLIPQARLLVILRQPVSRVYSSYKQYTWPLKKQSPEHFHEVVLKEINLFNRCMERNHNITHCLYPNKEQPLQMAHDPRRSIYYGYLVDLFKIFPRNQVYVLKAENYYANRVREMRKVVKFLGMQVMDSETEKKLLVKSVAQSASVRYERVGLSPPGPMLNKTRDLLTRFYKPWNTKLSELLNNEDYLWNESN